MIAGTETTRPRHAVLRQGRVDAQPAYLLHIRPWRETSLLLEAFTRDYGRIALAARGARRPHSVLRGLMLAFQPLEISWSGKGEILNLVKAEWQGGQPPLSGLPLFCGYYLNELLLRLLPREDAHPELFAHYLRALMRLGYSTRRQVAEADLRGFERALLAELGYGLTLDRDTDGAAIAAHARYRYEIERGPSRVLHSSPEDENAALVLSGQTLIDVRHDDYLRAATRNEAKQLMRRLLTHYLDGAELESRKWVRELQELC
ncbi:MAG: DNA repair protein RecO [Zoogloeaceae bacterium]|jgi:DNA repair protein RecO (recombination protein O)|nr:DNA repair protein RecO [Zoogloeaceae bacterium]